MIKKKLCNKIEVKLYTVHLIWLSKVLLKGCHYFLENNLYFLIWKWRKININYGWTGTGCTTADDRGFTMVCINGLKTFLEAASQPVFMCCQFCKEYSKRNTLHVHNSTYMKRVYGWLYLFFTKRDEPRVVMEDDEEEHSMLDIHEKWCLRWWTNGHWTRLKKILQKNNHLTKYVV